MTTAMLAEIGVPKARAVPCARFVPMDEGQAKILEAEVACHVAGRGWSNASKGGAIRAVRDSVLFGGAVAGLISIFADASTAGWIGLGLATLVAPFDWVVRSCFWAEGTGYFLNDLLAQGYIQREAEQLVISAEVFGFTRRSKENARRVQQYEQTFCNTEKLALLRQETFEKKGWLDEHGALKSRLRRKVKFIAYHLRHEAAFE